jgi:hypothetical protein
VSESCLVRVTGKLGDREFDAGLAIDELGSVYKCAPILAPHVVIGSTKDEAREACKRLGWKATMVAILTGPQIKGR